MTAVSEAPDGIVRSRACSGGLPLASVMSCTLLCNTACAMAGFVAVLEPQGILSTDSLAALLLLSCACHLLGSVSLVLALRRQVTHHRRVTAADKCRCNSLKKAARCFIVPEAPARALSPSSHGDVFSDLDEKEFPPELRAHSTAHDEETRSADLCNVERMIRWQEKLKDRDPLINRIVASWPLEENTRATWRHDAQMSPGITLLGRREHVCTGFDIRDFTGQTFDVQPTPIFQFLGGMFPGTGDVYEDLGDRVRAELGGAFSVAFTARWQAINLRSCVIDFGNGSLSDNIIVSSPGGTSRSLEFSICRGSTMKSVAAEAAILAGEFQTFLCSVTAMGTMSIHLDGALVAQSKDGHVPRKLKRSKLLVGRSNWGHESAFHGEIRSLYLWTAAVSWNAVPVEQVSGGDLITESRETFVGEAIEQEVVTDQCTEAPRPETTPSTQQVSQSNKDVQVVLDSVSASVQTEPDPIQQGNCTPLEQELHSADAALRLSQIANNVNPDVRDRLRRQLLAALDARSSPRKVHGLDGLDGGGSPGSPCPEDVELGAAAAVMATAAPAEAAGDRGRLPAVSKAHGGTISVHAQVVERLSQLATEYERLRSRSQAREEELVAENRRQIAAALEASAARVLAESELAISRARCAAAERNEAALRAQLKTNHVNCKEASGGPCLSVRWAEEVSDWPEGISASVAQLRWNLEGRSAQLTLGPPPAQWMARLQMGLQQGKLNDPVFLRLVVPDAGSGIYLGMLWPAPL